MPLVEGLRNNMLANSTRRAKNNNFHNSPLVTASI